MDEKQLYPLTIIADRYGGTYSGGRYIAFNLSPFEIPEEVEGSDIECMNFWEENKDLVVGKGTTAFSAFLDLKRKVEGNV